MKETTSTTWKKLAEIETKDFTSQGILEALTNDGLDDFTIDEVESMIKNGWIEICEDGIIVWYDGI
jgi:hypothetical protein